MEEGKEGGILWGMIMVQFILLLLLSMFPSLSSPEIVSDNTGWWTISKMSLN